MQFSRLERIPPISGVAGAVFFYHVIQEGLQANVVNAPFTSIHGGGYQLLVYRFVHDAGDHEAGVNCRPFGSSSDLPPVEEVIFLTHKGQGCGDNRLRDFPLTVQEGDWSVRFLDGVVRFVRSPNDGDSSFPPT